MGKKIKNKQSTPYELPFTIRAQKNKIDLHGLNREEAVDLLDEDFDIMLRCEKKYTLIIHGHGKGILKKTVREYLINSPYVEKFRPGIYGEGGDAVTLVSLNI